MSMQLKYYGEFYSQQGVLWRVEISQPSDEPLTAKELRFPGDDALEIEWSNTDKLEPIISSSATLVLRCTNDREYTGLYTEEVGSIRLNVYHNNAFYWSGTLDPELYEEPFAYEKEYDVPLSFSDFAPVDRVKFAGTGLYTLRELINMALNNTGMYFDAIEEYISTYMKADNTGNLLDGITLVADNFYDEEGEPNTLYEVLEEVLRPLALRIVQKGGKIVIFDLNHIYTSFEPEQIHWVSEDSVLGVDKVYNNVRVAFSPYDRTELMSAEISKDDYPEPESGGTQVNINNDASTPGFKIYLGDTSEIGPYIISGKGKPFYIKPIYSGSECRGVAALVRPYYTGSAVFGSADHVFSDDNMNSGVVSTELFRITETPYLGNLPTSRPGKFRLKVTLEFLYDVRINPFEGESTENEEGNWDRLENWCNFAYVPIILNLCDSKGNVLYHYENHWTVREDTYLQTISWTKGEGSWGKAFLTYYDKSNRKNKTGLGGWKTNQPTIGYYSGNLPSFIDKLGEGELIVLPPASGWLQLKVGTGLHQFDYERESKDIYQRARWALYKNPRITLVDEYGNNLNNEDVEHSAWLNLRAKEELKVDTIVGVKPNPSPAARGQILSSDSKNSVSTLFRNGLADCPERLLIGTAYSNYAHRNNVLSGTARIIPQFGIFSDVSEPGHYLLKSEVQDCMADESEIEMVEFDADNYEGIEYEK